MFELSTIWSIHKIHHLLRGWGSGAVAKVCQWTNMEQLLTWGRGVLENQRKCQSCYERQIKMINDSNKTLLSLLAKVYKLTSRILNLGEDAELCICFPIKIFQFAHLDHKVASNLLKYFKFGICLANFLNPNYNVIDPCIIKEQ
jgi:hypothetical protein